MDDEEKESTWGDILRALKAVDKSGFEPLHHVAGVTYLMKRHHHQPVAEEHEEFVVRKLEGPQQVAPLSGRASNEGLRKKAPITMGFSWLKARYILKATHSVWLMHWALSTYCV